MDLDIDSDDGNDEEPPVSNPVIFDAGPEQTPGWDQHREPFTDMPRAVQAVHDRDTEDVWAELG